VQRRHQPLGRVEPAVCRAVLPVRVVARVGHELLPHLVAVVESLAEVRGRALLQQPVVHVACLVGIADGAPDARLHVVDEVERVGGPEGAPVEPVVRLPGVDHGVEGHGRGERRVRLAQRREREPAWVRGAPDADLAVVRRHVLDEPVDRVPGVGGLVRVRAVEGAARHAVHRVPALRLEAAAQVLRHEDVAAPQEAHAAHHVEPLRGAPRGGARRVVGRPLEQDRQRRVGLLRRQDQRVELHAVAHRHHRLAQREVVARVRLAERAILCRSRERQDAERKDQGADGESHAGCRLHGTARV